MSIFQTYDRIDVIIINLYKNTRLLKIMIIDKKKPHKSITRLRWTE